MRADRAREDAGDHGVRAPCRSLRVLALTATLGTLAALPGTAGAQAWPAKPIRVVVPFGAGGGATIQSRLITENLRAGMGANFIIDNRPGAGGLLGAQVVAEAPPDGYTMLFTTSTLAVNTTLLADTLKFDPRKELSPASLISSGPLVLCVHPSVPARSVRELIALAKRHPGKLSSGANEVGSTGHLAAEMLNQLGGIDTTIVPYKGGGPALVGLLTGDVALLFVVAPVAMSQLQAKKIRGLAVTTPKPASAFPDLPPINATVPGLETDVWYATFFPRGTPAEIVARMSGEIRKVLHSDKVQAFYQREGIDAVGSSPQALRAHLEAEIAKYARVIRQSNIKAQ
ncbi:MAG: tripartite tricarboxylate transporter substrate binding protein [Burkholderiales bacterium]|nr:tripartite tricarboxylate transporter substrate binding protein [Burkholderiales bacterium]